MMPQIQAGFAESDTRARQTGAAMDLSRRQGSRCGLALPKAGALFNYMTSAPLPNPAAQKLGGCLVAQVNAHGIIERISGDFDLVDWPGNKPPGKGTSAFDMLRACLMEPEDGLTSLDILDGVLHGGPSRRMEACHTESHSTMIEVTVIPMTTMDLPGAILSIIEIPRQQQPSRKSQEEDAARLRAILDHEPACVKITDLEGRVREMNAAGLRILETESFEEVSGRDVMRFVVPEDRPLFMHINERCLAGETMTATFRITGAKGTLKWVESHCVPLRDAGGRVRELLAVSHDITSRHEAEQNLQKSKLRYERQMAAMTSLMRGGVLQQPALDQALEKIIAAISHSMDVERVSVWRFDRSRSSIVCLGLFERSSGKIARGLELNSTTFPGYFRALAEDEMIAAADACQDPRTREFAECYLKPLGIGAMLDTPLHVGGVLAGVLCQEHVGSPREWTEDEQSFALSLANLISLVFAHTQHHEDEEKLREQASLLDLARDAILVRDLNHQITYWNKSAERLYGWTAEEAVGKDISKLLYRDPAQFLTKTEQVLQHGEHICEIEHLTKNGREVIVEGHWTLVRDEEGRPQSILAINTDVTARRQAEEQLSRHQRLESIGTLAGGIAHDLNNVLTPILVSVDMLKIKTNDKSCLDTLGIISANARRGADMIKQLLSFARGAEGRRQSLRMHTLLQEIGAMVKDTFPKNISLDMKEQPGLWPVHADVTQMHQMLLNLCVNARDAMPKGGTLSVHAANTQIDAQYAASRGDARSGPHLLITITDEGTGMPKKLLSKIFDPFFTTKEAGKGTGLGLSTTLAIVKSHSGFIEIDSEQDHGTSFRVYLPADPSAFTEECAEPVEHLPRGENQMVLVVDDEAPVREITCQSLQTFGYRVMSASNGAEASALYARHQNEIDAVLTDMMMPVMDGASTIQVIRKLRADARIIAASGVNTEMDATRAKNCGADIFLPKPYNTSGLLTALEQLLRPRTV